MSAIPDDLSIPEFLRRPVTAQTKAAATRLNNELRRGDRRVVQSSGRSTISAGHAANLDEAGKTLLKEVRQNERKATDQRMARLRALKKEKSVMGASNKPGKKEQQLRETRSGGSKTKPKLSELAQSIGAKPVGAAPVVEVSTAAPAKKSAPAKAKKPERLATDEAVDVRPDGLRKDSKQAIMLDMVLKDGGATEEQICKKLGWKKCRVTLRRVCDKVGAKLDRNAETGKFTATMPVKKAA